MGKAYFVHANNKPLMRVLPSDHATYGNIKTSDVDAIVRRSTDLNTYELAHGTTVVADVRFAGLIAAVPTASTPGSTVPFYIKRLSADDEIEMPFSTTYSATIPGTTDIGKWVGYSTSTTVGGAVLCTSSLSTDAGASFLKVTGFSTNRKTIRGYINSSHIEK